MLSAAVHLNAGKTPWCAVMRTALNTGPKVLSTESLIHENLGDQLDLYLRRIKEAFLSYSFGYPGKLFSTILERKRKKGRDKASGNQSKIWKSAGDLSPPAKLFPMPVYGTHLLPSPQITLLADARNQTCFEERQKNDSQRSPRLQHVQSRSYDNNQL